MGCDGSDGFDQGMRDDERNKHTLSDNIRHWSLTNSNISIQEADTDKSWLNVEECWFIYRHGTARKYTRDKK